MPTTLNVSLPRMLKDFVEREVARGGYASASEYVREILREEIARRRDAELERELLRGLASAPSPWTAADRRRLRARARAAAARQ